MLKRLIDRNFQGLFQTVTLTGNTFGGDLVLAAGVLLNFSANHLANPRPSTEQLGIMVARSATASGNLADRPNGTTLVFLTTKGQFRGAANTVNTQPASTP